MNRFRKLRQAGVIALSLTMIATTTPAMATETPEDFTAISEEAAQLSAEQSVTDSATESGENKVEAEASEMGETESLGTGETESPETEEIESSDHSEYLLSSRINYIEYNGVDSYASFYYTAPEGRHYEFEVSSSANLKVLCGESAMDGIYLYDADTGATLGFFSSEGDDTAKLLANVYLEEGQRVCFNLPGAIEKPSSFTWEIGVFWEEHTEGEIQSYVTRGGREYKTYEDIPCTEHGIYYSICYICPECGRVFKVAGYKSHSWEEKEYYVGDTTYSAYEDIPCDTAYQMLQVCGNCGEEKVVDSYKSHTYDTLVCYTDAENNVYEEADLESIPHGADLTGTWKCNSCGQEFSKEIKHWNLNADIILYIDSDQNTYSNEEDIPCETMCTTVWGCRDCGETLDEETIAWYELESEVALNQVYYKLHSSWLGDIVGDDGVSYEDSYFVPCGMHWTNSYVCDYCGEQIVEEGYGQHTGEKEQEALAYYSEDGTYVNVDDVEKCKSYTGCYKCLKCGETFLRKTTTHSGFGPICYTCGMLNYNCSSLGEEVTGIVLDTPKIIGQDGDTVTISETFYYDKYEVPAEVKWQSSTDQGQTWIDCEGGTCENYAFTLASSDDGKLYRCIVSFNGEEYISETIPVIFEGITEQPADCTALSGENFDFYIMTESIGWTYLWQYSDDAGETWTDTECTDTNYSGTADTSIDGRLFRCVIADTDGNEIISDTAKLTVEIKSSGTCGENLTWNFEDGTLTISGFGDMDDYNSENAAPWSQLCGDITDVVLSEGVTDVGVYAFCHCEGLTSVTIPDSVTSIDQQAFYQCSQLTDITIPDSVTSIGALAFGESGLTSLILTNGMISIDDYAFSSCPNLVSIILPDGLTSIGESVFDSCSSLNSITFPDTLTTIGPCAFSGCCSLENITFPDSLISINFGAFVNCTGLTSIIIPENVTLIDGAAFTACRNLTDVYIYSRQMTRCDGFSPVEGQIITIHGYSNLQEIIVSLQNPQIVFDNLEAPRITSQPEDTSAVAGEKFIFTVEAESSTGSTLSYLWQYSKDGGETWIDTTRTKDNFSTTATTAMNGRMFRCEVTDASGNSVISDAATLTVKPAIEITSQTDAQTVNVGELYRFRVAAVSNTGSKLTYLWQYSKTLKGWTDTTRTVNNYGTYATVGVDGKYFRCKITDEAGNVVYSTPAMVRVLSDITITEQPADTTVASGKRFYFTVTATGSSLTYLWQYSADGGQTWIDTTRARNNYTTYAKKGMDGRMFRCVITDSSNNTVISEAGTLTVK